MSFSALMSTCKLENDLIPLTDLSFAQSEMQKNQGRSSWQKPHLVINKLGDISDKTIADIGAGTGFFSFRLAMKAKKIISTDIDSTMIELIELQKENLPTEISAKIESRLVLPTDPGLLHDETDIVVIINTITFIANPNQYLNRLHDICKLGTKILVVDFKKIAVNMPAPPIEERFEAQEVAQLLSDAGFVINEIDESTLDYQYIITAEK